MLKKNKLKLRQKLINVCLTTIFLFVLFFSPIQTPKADAWDAIPAQVFKQVLEEIDYELHGIILGMLKRTAVIILNGQVDNLMGGANGSSAAFITNWQSYLVDQPTEKAQTYINDYLSQMTIGRGTMTGYTSEGFAGNGNYMANLKQQALAKVNSSSAQEVPHITYESSPNQMFDNGNFKNMSNYLSGINNPWAFNLAVQNAYQKKLEEEKSVQQAKAIAYQGFKGTGDDGANSSISNPGSLIKTNIANVQNISNVALGSATHPAEVVTLLVSQMITKAIHQGFSSVQSSISREVNAIKYKNTKEINNSINKFGPGARFR